MQTLVTTMITRNPNMDKLESNLKFMKNEKGISFITIDSAGQRIKVLDKVGEITDETLKFKCTTGSISECIDIAESSQYYALPEYTKVVNNNRSTAPMIIPVKRDNNDVVLYLTITDDLQILSYTSTFDINFAYKKIGKYHGCMVVVPEEDLYNSKKDNTIMIMDVKYSGKFYELTVKLSSVDSGSPVGFFVCTAIEEITDKDHMEYYANIAKKRDVSIQFRINTSELVTMAYVYPDDISEDLMKKFENKSKHIKVKEMIAIPSKYTDKDYLKKKSHPELINILKQHTGFQSITVLSDNNFMIPYDVFKGMGYSFVFKYIKANNRIACEFYK